MIYPALLYAFDCPVWNPGHVDVGDFLPVAIWIGTPLFDETVRTRFIEVILNIGPLRVGRIESLRNGTQSLSLYLLDPLLL